MLLSFYKKQASNALLGFSLSHYLLISLTQKGKNSGQHKKKNNLKKEIIQSLIEVLNAVNPYVKEFRSARDIFKEHPEETFHMRIVSDRFKDGRTYNTPTASEIAALIPGDFNLDMDKRDIVLQKHSGKLMRISEIHAAYLALQYPLIFIYGEDGYRLGINKGVTEATKKQKKTDYLHETILCISFP